MKSEENSPNWLLYASIAVTMFGAGFYFRGEVIGAEIRSLERQKEKAITQSNQLTIKITELNKKIEELSKNNSKEAYQQSIKENVNINSSIKRKDEGNDLDYSAKEKKIKIQNQFQIANVSITKFSKEFKDKVKVLLIDIEQINNEYFKINYLFHSAKNQYDDIRIKEGSIEIIDQDFNSYQYEDYEIIPVTAGYNGTSVPQDSFLRASLKFKGNLNEISTIKKLQFKLLWTRLKVWENNFFSFKDIKIR